MTKIRERCMACNKKAASVYVPGDKRIVMCGKCYKEAKEFMSEDD